LFRPKPGAVYRTADLQRWTANAPRMVQRLVKRGELKPLAQGLYAAPRKTKFGEAPPPAEAVMDAFLKGTEYVFTGPAYWNALGLGATALFPAELVYNRKRTGEFNLGGRRFLLRRRAFPKRPTAEWYAVDLILNRKLVGLDLDTLVERLGAAVKRGELDGERLLVAAERFGTKETLGLVRQVARADAK
jgi:hypothetical protein